MRHLVLLLVAAGLAACSDNAGKLPLATQDGTLTDDVMVGDQAGTPPDGEASELTADVTADLAVPDAADAAFLDIGTGPELPDPTDLVLIPEVVEDAKPEDVPLPPEEVVEPDVVLPPGQVCADIWECGIYKGCMAPGPCWDVCLEDASPAALPEFEALMACHDEMCINVADEEKGACMMEMCIEPIIECLGGDGTMGCVDTLECVQGCGDTNPFCFFECLKDADEEAVETVIAMAQAAEDELFLLLIDCAGGQGEASCGEAITCVTQCNPDEGGDDNAVMNCMMDCMALTSPEGQQDMTNFFNCALEACPDGLDDCQAMFGCFSECPGLAIPF